MCEGARNVDPQQYQRDQKHHIGGDEPQHRVCQRRHQQAAENAGGEQDRAMARGQG
jgi:hypothetical protein